MLANTLRKFQQKIPVGLVQFLGNLYPPYLGAGIKITFISNDYSELDVRMKLTWYNRNYVGTQFGGSLYAMTDPFFMFLLMNKLGKDYIVWDKAAKIDFKRPGRTTVYAKFQFSEAEVAEIKNNADTLGKYIFDRTINITDEHGEVVAEVIKTLYVRRKSV